MVHPALLRSPATLAFAAGRPPADRRRAGDGTLPEAAKRLFRRLNRWAAPRYRPERHYMRGGRTAGAKSLAAAT